MNAFARRFFLLSLLALLFPWTVLSAQEKEPEIRDIVVTTSRTHLLLSAGVQNAFPPSLLSDLHQGQTINFIYDLELVKVGSWFNSTLVELTVTRSLSYNQQNKRYQVVFSEQRDKPQETANLAEARKLTAEISGIRVTGLSDVAVDETYAIHVRMRLEMDRSKSGLQRLLSGSPDWETKTDWRTIEFRY